MSEQFGASIDCCSAIVCGSRKSSRLCRSATTIAARPSGVKYRLYGSSTGMAVPGLPVLGSIGVKLPLLRRAPLFATHKVFRSQDGMTCCGLAPTENRSTTENVAGSITYTLFERRFGTYTRDNAPPTVELK